MPPGPWGRTLALALALFVLVMGALELHWRKYGLVPNVGDSLELWSYERDRVYSGPFRKTLVLVGGSRLLCDADLDVLAARLPGYDVVQLSVLAKTPIATLRDLAADLRLHDASVLVDVAEHALEKQRWDEQQSWVDHFHRRVNLTADFEIHAASLLQSRLVVANPSVGFAKLLEERMPKRDYVTYGPDRSCRSDYSLTDAVRARAARTARVKSFYAQTPAPDADTWLAQAIRVEDFVRQLTARNVRVAFFRPPTTGDHWTLDAEQYPVDRYWNRFRAAISVPAIHFKDEPGLDQFDAPDGSHLDQKDIGLFTECLVDVLVREGVVEASRVSVGSGCHLAR